MERLRARTGRATSVLCRICRGIWRNDDRQLFKRTAAAPSDAVLWRRPPVFPVARVAGKGVGPRPGGSLSFPSAGLIVLLVLAPWCFVWPRILGRSVRRTSRPPTRPIAIGVGKASTRAGVWVHEPGRQAGNGKTGNWWDDPTRPARVDQRSPILSANLTGADRPTGRPGRCSSAISIAQEPWATSATSRARDCDKINANQDPIRSGVRGKDSRPPTWVHAVLAQPVRHAGVPAQDITVL